MWTLIEASKTSIYTPLIADKPHGLIETIIRSHKFACFSEIFTKSDINLLMPCGDGRPLVSLIFELNPANRIRSLCTSSHPQLNSAYFINQAKKALFVYAQKTTTTYNLAQDLLMLDSFKGGNALPKPSTSPVATRESSFFSFVREQSEEKSFLNTPWIQESINAYARKCDAFRTKLQRNHQSHVYRTNKIQYEHSLPEEKINRLKYLFETMTESDVRLSLEALHTQIDLSFEYFEVSEQIRLKSKSMGKNKLKALYDEADALKAKLDMCQGRIPNPSSSPAYPGIKEPLLSVLKKIDSLSSRYELTNDPDLIPMILAEMDGVQSMSFDVPEESSSFFENYFNTQLSRLFSVSNLIPKP